MATMVQQSSAEYVKQIAESLLTSKNEKDLYNDVLEDAIKRIELAVAGNPALQETGTLWTNRLRKQLVANNSYVRHARKGTPLFSLNFCVGMQDVTGLKYLLRVGENPNNLEDGKRTALHMAAARGHRAMVEVLLQCPQLDATVPNFLHKTALQLAKDPEIRAILSRV